MTTVPNLFTADELALLNGSPQALTAFNKLVQTEAPFVYFSIPTSSLPLSIAHKLKLFIPDSPETISHIPMRWVQGDVASHVDLNLPHTSFANTYLVYLTDSPGELVIGDSSHPITQNTGHSFSEGLLHETRNTLDVPRLLMGPMNERIEPVGIPPAMVYFTNEMDALNYSNSIETDYSGSYILSSISGFPYTSWRIASNSNGTSSQSGIYTIGQQLNPLDENGNPAYYFLYPATPCFKDGTKILCQIGQTETSVAVEELKVGMLVKTCLHGFKPIVMIGHGKIENPGNAERLENRLYRCTPSQYPDLTEDLYITGCHSILEFPITEKQKEDTIQHLGKLFVTDNKYRLMACVDDRAEPWANECEYSIYHFALEHEDERMNYGVFANGLLVESCSIRHLKKSNLDKGCV